MKASMLMAAIVVLGVVLPYSYAWKCASFCNAEVHKCMTSCVGFEGCKGCVSSADNCRNTCRRRREMGEGLHKRFQLNSEDASQ